jgi:hypothetical protein
MTTGLSGYESNVNLPLRVDTPPNSQQEIKKKFTLYRELLIKVVFRNLSAEFVLY